MRPTEGGSPEPAQGHVPARQEPRPQETEVSVDPEILGLGRMGLTTFQQAQETKLKIAQLGSRRTEKLVAASQADTHDRREHESRRHLRVLIFSAFLVVVVVGFGVYAIEKGQVELVKEIVKIVGAAVLGGLGGWGLRGHRDRNETPALPFPDYDDEDFACS